MIGCFPALHPDELLYSGCARFCERVRYASGRYTVVELFGAANMKAVVDLPSHLETFIQRLPPGHTLTADRLINERTLFPFYSSFLPIERVATLRGDMAGDKGKRIHTGMGIKASRVPCPKYLRYCPDCVAWDRQKYEETYWHRVHQIPGVLVCPQHTRLLQDSPAFAQPIGRFEFSSAEHSIPRMVLTAVGASYLQDEHIQKLHGMAQDAAWLLSDGAQAGSTLGPAALQAKYAASLHSLGLAHTTGRLDSKKLVAAFTAYYSPALLELLGCALGDDKGQSWLSQLVRPNNIARHPLYHLLLMGFLGHTAAEFFRLPTPAKGEKGNVEIQQVRLHTDRGAKLREQRTRWQSLMQKRPGAGVAALRCERPALYLWLYRNDRDWLTLNRPPSLRGMRRPLKLPAVIDWAQRDLWLAAQIEAEATRIKSVKTRPVRITAASIGRGIGVAYTPMLRLNASKLPLARTILSKVLESREQYGIRLVEWACGLYESEGVMPQRWQLVKRAGVYRMYSHPAVRAGVDDAMRKLAAAVENNAEEASQKDEHMAA